MEQYDYCQIPRFVSKNRGGRADRRCLPRTVYQGGAHRWHGYVYRRYLYSQGINANGVGIQRNQTKVVGDPTIVWTIGCERFNPRKNESHRIPRLPRCHHRRGVMSAAVRMLVDNWAASRMNCQRIITSAMLGNTASVGAFKKLGFKHVEDV